MASGRGSDRLTGWWRGISLRAKVTGVTVGILVLGLVGVGAGATVFLRNALIGNLDTTLEGLVRTDIASSLFDITGPDEVSAKPDVPPTDFYVALYASEGGQRLINGGGVNPGPDFPTSYSIGDAVMKGITPFPITDAGTGAEFRASVAPLEVTGVTGYFTQMVALPLADVNRVVATFLGIYTILALITIIAAAVGMRWLVTLTFRSLGQVESTAMSIAAGDFSLRMTDIEPANTEVGRLKLAINAMLGRVDSALSQRDATVRQMRRFIGDASHELRTPLVTVRGYAELYRMGAVTGDEQVAQSMERIEKEAIRMGVLVEDLLALARLDERRDLAVTPVDLRPIARDAALDARAASPQRTVTVVDTTTFSAHLPAPADGEPTLDTAPGSTSPRRRSAPATSAMSIAGATISRLRRRPRVDHAPHDETAEAAPSVSPALSAGVGTGRAPIVLGDENRIRQVVANLLGNARRYTPADSPIELHVGVDRDAGEGWITVCDHGDGIPEQIRDKIFQRFWRADTSRTRETGGSGLGLSIVASIVEALHGTISVEETPGGGATFRVGLPLAQERDASEHLLIETRPLPRLSATTD